VERVLFVKHVPAGLGQAQSVASALTSRSVVRILVTGSSGHLGEALMRVLPGMGHDALGLDIKPSAFTTEVGSIVDRRAVRRCLDGVDAAKNIYGVTKVAAEDLCELFHRDHRLPCVVLRTSRFFPEEDDNPHTRQAYDPANAKVNELLYRRVDVEDVVKRRVPHYEEAYARRAWKMFPSIDRVYVNHAARRDLGWRPRYDFARALEATAAGEDYRSPLSRAIGSKGYHDAASERRGYPFISADAEARR
jgi:nucleoside-diphosphate-sugar epimerase